MVFRSPQKVVSDAELKSDASCSLPVDFPSSPLILFLNPTNLSIAVLLA